MPIFSFTESFLTLFFGKRMTKTGAAKIQPESGKLGKKKRKKKLILQGFYK